MGISEVKVYPFRILLSLCLIICFGLLIGWKSGEFDSKEVKSERDLMQNVYRSS